MATYRFSRTGKRFATTNTNTLYPATPISPLSPANNCDLCVTPVGHTPTGCWIEWADSRIYQMVITDWDFSEYVAGELDTGSGGIPPAELDEINTLKIYLDSTKWLNVGTSPCSISQEVTMQTTNIRVEVVLSFVQGNLTMIVKQGRLINDFTMSTASTFKPINPFETNPLLQFNGFTPAEWLQMNTFDMKRTSEAAANYPENFTLAKVFYS